MNAAAPFFGAVGNVRPGGCGRSFPSDPEYNRDRSEPGGRELPGGLGSPITGMVLRLEPQIAPPARALQASALNVKPLRIASLFQRGCRRRLVELQRISRLGDGVGESSRAQDEQFQVWYDREL